MDGHSSLDHLQAEMDHFTRDHRSLSILFIDDNKFIRDLFRKIMISFGMPEVSVAESAEDGLRKINENYYDLVITDIVMGAMSGVCLVKSIRNKLSPAGTRQTVPIVMLTAHTEERLVLACAKAGANAYLTKPLVPAKLMQIIAKLCHCTTPTLGSHCHL